MNPGDFEQRKYLDTLYSQIEALNPVRRGICKYFVDRIPKWNQIDPDFLVLTARSASVYQPLIKRVWMRAYDPKSVPEIMNVDPHVLQDGVRLARSIVPAGKLSENSRVLIFDEISGKYNDDWGPQRYLPDEPGISKSNRSLDKVAEYIRGLGVRYIWMDAGTSALWGSGSKALLQRKFTDQGESLERRREKSDIHMALEHAKKMRDLGEFISELIKNKVEIKE